MFESKDRYCRDCGFVSEYERKGRGSLWVALLLLCFFVIPGVIYIVWNLATKYRVCGECGSSAIIPVASPEARRALLAQASLPPPLPKSNRSWFKFRWT